RFDLHRIDGYRNFCNKLWNAARFVLMNCQAEDLEGEATLSLADRWILSRTHHLLAASDRAVDTYRFDLYAAAVYDFAWHEYCDWYLELTKPLLWNEDTPAAVLRGTRRTLLTVLEALLRIAHPMIPFITEAIWRETAPLLDIRGATIMLQPFPEADDFSADPEADAAIAWLQGMVLGVRNIRGEANLKPKQMVNVLLQGGNDRDRTLAAATEDLFRRLAGVEAVSWLAPEDTPPANALSLVGELKIMIPLAGLIDLEGERARLQKEFTRKQQELQRLTAKLDNPEFVDKAPEAVVARERQKQRDAEAALSTLQTQLATISNA
ncbi:MAG: class I tRNA ligase family protein, partial [Pseudomonadales bacterium]